MDASARLHLGVVAALFLMLVLALACCGCGAARPNPVANHDAGAQPPGAALTGVPAPEAALLRMGKSAGEPVYGRFGREFNAALSQRANAEGDCVRLSPDWTRAEDAIGGLAYGLYPFNLTDYSGAASFTLAWAEAPEDLSHVWLGLSDWERGRWQWFACPAGGTQSLPAPPGLAPYIKAGTNELLAAIVMTGQGAGVLHMCGMQFSEPVDAWPVLGHDVKHTGRSLNLGPTTNTLKWKFKTHDATGEFFSPVVAADGSAYIYQYNGSLSALNPDGSVRWQQNLGTVHGLALAPDGTLYAGAGDASASFLAAIDANGNRLWTFTPQAPGTAIYAPAIGADGAIYCSALQYVYVLNPDGSVRDKLGDGVGLYGPLLLGPDAALYTSKSGKLTKYDLAGNIIWQAAPYFMTGTEFMPLAVDSTGAVFACLDGVLTALNADGTQRWTSIHANHESQPVLAKDGTIYLGGYTSLDSTTPAFFAINPDGSEQWHITAATDVESPYVAPDGTVYFTDDHLRAVTPDGVEQWACPLKVTGDGRIGADAAGQLYVVGSYYSRTYNNKRSLLSAVTPVGNVAWNWGGGGRIEIVSQPVIGADETVYFGTDAGTVYALNPDGSEKWDYATDARVQCALTVSPENEVYVVDDLGSLHALDANGALRWVYSLDYYTGAAFGAPILGPDGVVYYSDCGEYTGSGGYDNPGQYHAINADGTLKWSHVFDSQMQMAATLREDGSTLVCSMLGYLHCFSADGTVRWESAFPTGAFCLSSALASNGDFYIASDGLKAIAQDGTAVWSIGAYANTLGGPALAVDGTVYYSEKPDYTSDSSWIRAISPAGAELWTTSVELPGALNSAVALSLDAAGCIYCGSGSGLIYEFNPDGSLKQTFDTGRAMWVTPVAIGADRTIYAGSCDGYLYAFGD